MKRLALLCFLVMVFALGTAHAQQYEVAPSGTKNFTAAEAIAPGGTISLDIYLTGVSEPQHAGGVWIDFCTSPDVLFLRGCRHCLHSLVLLLQLFFPPCNVNVDADDVTKLLEDFGRNQFNNPCPPCAGGDWCVPYPLPLTGVEGRVYYSTTPLPDIKVSLLHGSTQEEIIYTYSDGNGNYELVYDTPGYYCLHPEPPASEYASIGYCSSLFIQEGEMIPFDVDLPKKLNLTSPPHLGIISDTTPTLVWEANPLAVSYELHVEDLDSQTVVILQEDITGTSYTIPSPLPLGVYYWSVLGYDAADHLVGFGGAQFTIEE